MKNNPLISVIITNYNYGEYVSKAMDSVIGQTYQNIELIVINDGSTDDSDKIIRSFISKNPEYNIRYIKRENKGVVYTRNEGIDASKGDYICYLDADDYFNRDYIEKSYKVAKESGADVVYPNWHFIGDWLGRPDTNFPEYNLELLQLQKLHCTPASLIRKDSIGGRRFEAEKVAEDWDFFLGLSLDGAEFKLAKNNHINYRIRQGTRSSRNSPREDTQYFVEILQKHKALHGDKVIDLKRLIRLRHPNIIMKVLSMRYPRAIIDSVKKDGVRATSIKIIRKIVFRSDFVWKFLRKVRNRKYQHWIKGFSVRTSPQARLAVIVHLYYPDLWPIIEKRLKNIKTPFDLFVSVQVKDKDTVLDKINSYHGFTNIIALPNRGRDVLPFMIISSEINKTRQYDYLLKLHSKKSLHRDDGNLWLNSLLDQLIPADTSDIIKTLELPNTGMIGPRDHIVSLSRYMGGNRERLSTLANQISKDEDLVAQILKKPEKYPFFGGTMFWSRMDLIKPVLDSGVTPADFNTEGGQVDATTAHAIERILGKVLHKILDKKMYTVKDSIVKKIPNRSYNSKYEHGPSDG